MNGIHDMGGMHGFGPVPHRVGEPVFQAAWEGRVFAMSFAPVAIPGGFRFAIERLPPAHYLSVSYYERWMDSQLRGLVEAGIVSAEDVARQLRHFRRYPDSRPTVRYEPGSASRLLAATRERHPARRDSAGIVPAFHPGDRVRTRNMHPPGHFRMPQYVRGRRGTVTGYHDVQVMDDTLADGTRAQPAPLYTVRFEGAELWGEAAEAGTAVLITLWEPYLETDPDSDAGESR